MAFGMAPGRPWPPLCSFPIGRIALQIGAVVLVTARPGCTW
jgi:hypothetical protein